MIPTYLLPYLGSNSAVMDSMARSGGYEGPNVGFWFHITCLILMIGLAYVRTSRLTKKYLIIFPILALVFDMVPVLSWIPLVPTAMHVVTLIMGVTLAKEEAGSAVIN